MIKNFLESIVLKRITATVAQVSAAYVAAHVGDLNAAAAQLAQWGVSLHVQLSISPDALGSALFIGALSGLEYARHQLAAKFPQFGEWL